MKQSGSVKVIGKYNTYPTRDIAIGQSKSIIMLQVINMGMKWHEGADLQMQMSWSMLFHKAAAWPVLFYKGSCLGPRCFS